MLIDTNVALQSTPSTVHAPVLKINDHATGGRRTKDILGGPKGWGPKKKVANVEIYVIFEVFAFCGGRTKTDFKDRGETGPRSAMLSEEPLQTQQLIKGRQTFYHASIDNLSLN